MIFLESFHMLSCAEDDEYFNAKRKDHDYRNHMTCYTSTYPFVLFRDRDLPDFEFRDISIFCGNNGSGKSTILNVMSEKLKLKRDTPYNRGDYFDDYVNLCRYSLAEKLSPDSRIITSDDVFNRVLDIRRLNNGIDDQRHVLIQEYIRDKKDCSDNLLHGFEDYERWRKVRDARSKNVTQSRYLRERLVRNLQERSNGESALAFFVDSIADGALYLLDEPENSLSPSNQLELKYFIEDCVRNHGCQFIISTHSPFLLSLKGAIIYDIDSAPVEIRRWTELEHVRAYYDFFTENRNAFD
jgi:predicted ATPase